MMSWLLPSIAFTLIQASIVIGPVIFNVLLYGTSTEEVVPFNEIELGPPAATTLSVIALEVVVAEASSVAFAVSEYLPTATLVQTKVYGAVVSVPRSVVP